MTQLLVESGSAPVKNGNHWRAVLITPGKGSSGVYTESMLKEHGPKAFPKGTHSYVDHPAHEGEIRSPKNLMGVLAEDARFEPGVGLVAELNVMPHWKEFVEAVAPHTGLSIYAMGDGKYDENGDMVVESLIPHVQNSVDLVSYPGRPGSKLADKLYEAAIAMVQEQVAEKDLVKWTEGDEVYYGQVSYVMTEGVFPFEGDPLAIAASEDSPVAVVRIWDQDNGEWVATEELRAAKTDNLMKVSALGESGGESGSAAVSAAATLTIKEEGNSDMELKELSDQIAELPNLVAAAVAEALASSEEPEEKDEPTVEAVAEALIAAGLPEVSRKAVYESVRAGGNLNDAIEGQKAFVESVKAHLKEEAPAVRPVEETVIVTTQERAPRLSDILKVKVGA
jgi:hypothetical protein